MIVNNFFQRRIPRKIHREINSATKDSRAVFVFQLLIYLQILIF